MYEYLTLNILFFVIIKTIRNPKKLFRGVSIALSGCVTGLIRISVFSI